jgi:hypothetical protein
MDACVLMNRTWKPVFFPTWHGNEINQDRNGEDSNEDEKKNKWIFYIHWFYFYLCSIMYYTKK